MCTATVDIARDSIVGSSCEARQSKSASIVLKHCSTVENQVLDPLPAAVIVHLCRFVGRCSSRYKPALSVCEKLCATSCLFHRFFINGLLRVASKTQERGQAHSILLPYCERAYATEIADWCSLLLVQWLLFQSSTSTSFSLRSQIGSEFVPAEDHSSSG